MNKATAFVVPTGLLAVAGLAAMLGVAVTRWIFADQEWSQIGLPLLAGALTGAALGLAPHVTVLSLDLPAPVPPSDSPSAPDGEPAIPPQEATVA